MIRVLVVDDHPIVRQGLVVVLEDEADLEVVGAAGSAREALRAGRSDCGRTWCCSTWRCRSWTASRRSRSCWRRSPGLGVLVFTAYDTDERVLGAVRAGARGLPAEGRQRRRDRARHPHRPRRRLVSRAARGQQADGRGQLAAPRRAGAERARARSAAAGRRGLPTKQIARALSITERTVKFHVNSIFHKLGADNRAQAVALAAQRGLL